MRADDAKKLPLDRVLLQLGFSPVKQSKNRRELWYNSPFREEKEPSLHISTVTHPRLGTIWVWKDFGDIGGNVIDFAIRYFHLPANDVSGALCRLERYGALTQPSLPAHGSVKVPDVPSHPFTDVQIEPIESPALLNYLSRRGIGVELAKRYLQQVHYQFEGKLFSAIAFENDMGGYEMRSTGRFKGCLPPKTITLLHPEKAKSCREVTVFEGFMDYLSALTWYGRQEASTPVLILNSIVTEKAAIEKIQALGFSKVHLYLDRDTKGRELVEGFRKQLPALEVIDHSALYAGHKDFNDFLVAKQRRITISR